MKHYRTVLLIFAISYTLLIGSVYAATVTPDANRIAATQNDTDQDVASVNRDNAQDVAAALSVSKQDMSNALVAQQMQANRDALALLNARNQFWLQVLQTIMPILSAVGIAVVGWLQLKAARERNLMAASINGLKTELVATTRAAAFFEGAKLQSEAHLPGDNPSLVTARGLEISEAARLAGLEAHRVAAIAAGEKPVAHAATINVEVMTLKPGETASAEAIKGGGTSVTKDTA